jgi:serine/threonine-protein kinase
MSSPVLAPIPRRATGGSHLSTAPGTDPGWGQNEPTVEATVRAVPELMQTMQNPVPTPVTSDRTEAIVPTVQDEEGGFGFFKALTITLLLAALAIAAYYYYTNVAGSPGAEAYSPVPKNAPVPGAQDAVAQSPDLTPLYDQQIAMHLRTAQESRKAELEGDRLVQRGLLGLAATEYRKAFTADPRPELSLKLGEVYWQNGKPEEAGHWWARHMKDAPQSKAATYISQTLKSVGSMPMPPQQ